MPKKTYYLDEARTEPITVQWGLAYRNFILSHQGEPVVPAEHGPSLTEGYRYDLPDGRRLSAQLVRNAGLQELELLLNGQPLLGSATHPQERLKQAWYALLGVGSFSTILIVVAQFINVDALRPLRFGWAALLENIVLVGLGWWGYRQCSAAAFYVALGLLVVDWAVMMVNLAQAGGGGGIGSIFLRFVICAFVFRGAQAARELKREPAATLPVA
ncbi:hypothetical protein [Hymenobacter coccineus]|uniref:Uncharacterized protein n=1 Tax=Hymenobacter coccineus TaxID=1908235 RepID=A0A1G1TI39_9BACT|nr:hypothetical protein [Hymenobacter coccineus]OGX90534.1 hypothetical protein BEN49_06405 [Hymenobacter coccineus]